MNNTNRIVIDQTVLTTGGANLFVLGFAMLSSGFNWFLLVFRMWRSGSNWILLVSTIFRWILQRGGVV